MKRAEYKNRFASLRAWFKEVGVNGSLIPVADEFQTEFPPLHARRLGWLTGFTGSHGMAAVGFEQAKLFVPGLYATQARAQVDESLIDVEVVPPFQTELSAFVEGEKQGGVIACDARLVTATQAEAIKAQVEQAGLSMKWMLETPIDRFWTDAPAVPDQAYVSYPISLSGKSSTQKRAEIGESVSALGCDYAAITLADSICWLLNVRGQDAPISPLALSYALIDVEGNVLWFADERKISKELLDELGSGVALRPLQEFWPFLQTLNDKDVLVDEAASPFAVSLCLAKGGATFKYAPDPCQLPKAAKQPEEVQGMVRAHVRDGAALSRFLCWLETELRSGNTVSELDASKRLTGFRAEDACFAGVSFPPVSAAGAHAAMPHYVPTEETSKPIEIDQCYLLDSGGQYSDGGTTDVTRTIWLEGAPREFCDEYTRVLKGYIALDCQRFTTGTTGIALDTLARQFLWVVGKDYPHGTGHGVGAYLNVHEGPQRIASYAPNIPLEAGNIMSNEPAYYVEGSYGIRIENLVVVESADEEGDVEPMLRLSPITLAPIDTRLILTDQLTDAERDYLNDYHARVIREIGPLVDANTLDWLEARCAAI